MKLTVKILKIDTRGQHVPEGELRFDGKAITADPADSDMLKTIMSQPVRWPGQEPIDREKEPEKWMRNLYHMYRSPYLTALKAEIE